MVDNLIKFTCLVASLLNPHFEFLIDQNQLVDPHNLLSNPELKNSVIENLETIKKLVEILKENQGEIIETIVIKSL